MASYNEIDGIPSHSNKKLLTNILRDEWGFDGFVVSDGTGIDSLVNSHRIVKDYAEAGIVAVSAGINLSLYDKSFRYLTDAVKSEQIEIGIIDNAVRHILKAKFRLGLFENPYVNESGIEVVGCREHKEIALQADFL